MMQRLKTGLVLTSDVPLLFLDEPGIMLDNQNKQLFKSLLSTYLNNRMLVLASNDESDWSGLTIHHRIDLKPVTV
jgi:ABC-type multidrug transport system ATPase subunit